MVLESLEDSPRWYVLNHIGSSFRHMAKKEIDKFNESEGFKLELFAPTYVVREEKDGELRMKTANLTFHYIFVRGCFKQVKKLCCSNNGFSFLLNRSNSSERYATVSDRDMMNFMNIARAYRNCLPYFSLNGIDLEEGDLVEVIKGDFPGLIGRYMPKAKGTSGNIVLNVYNNVATIVFNVKATDVRVLEFSRKTSRANDQIDAFVPHLFTALRHYRAEETLPAPIAAKLSVFTGRMEVVRLNNRKLDARLQALLYGAFTVLGNADAAARAREKLIRLDDAVTNRWTSALIKLILAASDGTPALLEPVLATVAATPPISKAQKALTEEARYFAKFILP